MAELLRAKFTQHPKLAEVLMGTGAARIHYSGLGSPYWLTSGSTGRNWTGRLLELIRAELLARRAGYESVGGFGAGNGDGARLHA